MRTMVVVVAVMLALATSAHAQPGMSQPVPDGYASGPPMQVQLTVDEQWLLQRGYISDGETIGGGVVALFVGWGLGQAVQGRWSQKGYIFTAGEGVSTGVMLYGFFELFGQCFEGCSQARQDRYEALFVGGLIADSVFRIWEVYDAFAGPGEHNRNLTALRARLGMPPPLYTRLHPYVTPSHDRDGGGFAGVSLQF